MNAAMFFGKHYTEATRKPGQARRPGMKTLADQTDDEEEPGRKIRFRCPECREMTVMKKMLDRADEGDEEEAGMSRMAAARCAKCGEEVNLEAPPGHRWPAEAAHSFARRYGRATSESTRRHRHLAVAMTIR